MNKKRKKCFSPTTIKLAAGNVTGDYLEQLSVAVEQVAIGEFYFSSLRWSDRGGDFQIHLSKCPNCRRSFNNALKERV